jgi:hypothetical protein
VPIRHVVVAGESVVLLSERHGFFSQTIWDAPENAELRGKRPDMNTLLPGDVLFIPDKREKAIEVATGKRHPFRRKGIPAYFRMQVYDFGEPRRNEAYKLEVDGQTITGTTDGQGVLETPLPAGARSGVLTIGEDEHRLELQFGHLDPLDAVSGVQQRLENLGHPCGDPEGTLGAGTRAALSSFQRAQKLEVTGEIDDATRTRLGHLHDAEAPTTNVEPDGPPGGS